MDLQANFSQQSFRRKGLMKSWKRTVGDSQVYKPDLKTQMFSSLKSSSRMNSSSRVMFALVVRWPWANCAKAANSRRALNRRRATAEPFFFEKIQDLAPYLPFSNFSKH